MQHYHKALLAIIILSSCYFKLDSYGLAAMAIALIFVDPISNLLNSIKSKNDQSEQLVAISQRLNELSSKQEETQSKVTTLYNASAIKEMTGLGKK